MILETAQYVTLGSSLTTLTLGANLETLDASQTGTTFLNLTGNALDNTLIGNAAANLLTGGAGTDAFVGGLGDDTYVIDSLDELATLTENASEGNDTLKIAFANTSTTVAQTIALGSALGSIENITIAETVEVSMFGQVPTSTPTGLFNLIGSNFDNVLTGNAAANVLYGGAGNDTLDGGSGVDTAIFSGLSASYSVTKTSAGYTVNDNVGSDGTDTLTNVERLQFMDKTIAFEYRWQGGLGRRRQ